MTRETCATCRFWRRNEPYRDGRCRRSPPIYRSSSEIGDWAQPTVEPHDYCGEHQPVAPAPDASDDYTRAAVPLKTVLEEERDKAREQRDDYKRQLLELQRKYEAMTGASTYGNAAVMLAESDIALADCLGNVPHSDELLDEWREERNAAQERVNIHRDAFLRLYRERHGG